MGVDHERLRRWLIKEGRWQPGRKRTRHRAWRERKASFGQMVDDATNRTGARFFETWVDAYGLPGSLDVDRDSIYRCERVETVQEQETGQKPLTQLGRAMKVFEGWS